MDRTAKQHRIIILVSLSICLFIYVDSYLIPTYSLFEKVEDLNEYRTGKRGRHEVYTMTIRNKPYDIPEYLFLALSIGSSVVLEKSVLTGSLQKVVVVKEDMGWEYEAGYVRGRSGVISIPILIAGCFIMLIFFKSLTYIQGRSNLTYALLIFSILVLLAHLDLSIF